MQKKSAYTINSKSTHILVKMHRCRATEKKQAFSDRYDSDILRVFRAGGSGGELFRILRSKLWLLATIPTYNAGAHDGQISFPIITSVMVAVVI